MRQVFLALLSLTVLLGCGGGFFVAKVKQYYFAIEPATSENRAIFSKLFEELNERCNAPYLNIVRRGALSASGISTITVSSGLRKVDNKLGWGRWIRTTKLNSRRGFLQRPHKVRKDIYTMELEFDREFMQEHARARNEAKYSRWRTLFLHELGHGFQMGHDPERSSVMYSRITSGYKDYDTFYERAYNFLRN